MQESFAKCGNAQAFMFHVEPMARLVPVWSRVDRVPSTTFGRYRNRPRGYLVYGQSTCCVGRHCECHEQLSLAPEPKLHDPMMIDVLIYAHNMQIV